MERVYFIDYADNGSAVIRTMDRHEAIALANAGYAVQIFNTIDEARRERDLVGRLNNRVESN